MRVIRTCAAAIMAPLVLAACTTTAQPSYVCTGESGTTIRCTKESQDAQRAADLEAEAKEVYQRFWNEYMRLLRQGGTLELSDELKATMMSPALDSIEAHLVGHHEEGLRTVSLRANLTIRGSHEYAIPDSAITLIGCEDTTGSLFINANGEEVGTGVRTEKARHFKRVDGNLKIFDTTQREACEA